MRGQSPCKDRNAAGMGARLQPITEVKSVSCFTQLAPNSAADKPGAELKARFAFSLWLWARLFSGTPLSPHQLLWKKYSEF